MNLIYRTVLLALHALSVVYCVYIFGDVFSRPLNAAWVLLAAVVYFLQILGLIVHIKEFIFFINNKNKNKRRQL
jgi:hypothetical protein